MPRSCHVVLIFWLGRHKGYLACLSCQGLPSSHVETLAPGDWGIAGSRREERQAPAQHLGRISSAAPMTYMVGGKHYVALHGMEMLTVCALQ
jgi:hypothetical protein